MAIDCRIADQAEASPIDDSRPMHSVQTAVVAGWQWVGLAHYSPPSYLVLLKIAPTANEHDAVHALEWWLHSPGREDGDVIEVM